MSKLDARLCELFVEYQNFRMEGAYRSAITTLGGIYHCVPKLGQAERTKWSKLIAQQSLPEDLVRIALDGLNEDARRIGRILAYGSRWNDDETLLVLTLRVEIELGLSFLNQYCPGQALVATSDIDERIEALAKTNENKRSFEAAINLMNKNWGLPIESRWMSRDLGRHLTEEANIP